jgi:hypothetical protein
MTNTPTQAFFAVFKGGEILLEYDNGQDCWTLPRRIIRRPPDERLVEMSFNNVLREVNVHEVMDIGSIIDCPAYVSTLSSKASCRDTEIANFFALSNLENKKKTKELETALALPNIKDRFL